MSVVTQFLSGADRHEVFSKVMGLCRRLGDARVRAYIRAVYGVPSGQARQLDDYQLVMLLVWCVGELLGCDQAA